jgi:hypothetical protein
MSTAIVRTVTASELRDPEVLAEAGRGPIGVYDVRRQESLVLTSRASFDTDQRLQSYLGMLAHAVVELSRDDPSSAALGAAGYVADWLPADRSWWLRNFAEAVSAAVADGSTEPVAGFIVFASMADAAVPSRLESPISIPSLSPAMAAKLKLRTA